MNILDYNHCLNNCKCGWNITIGGTSTVELLKVKDALQSIGIEADLTQYDSKLNTEKFVFEENL